MLELRRLADGNGEGPPWPLAGVELVGEAPRNHNFSDRLVGQGIAEGWVEIDGMRIEPQEGYSRSPVLTGDALVLHLVNGHLRYRILRSPGRYDGEESHEYVCELEA